MQAAFLFSLIVKATVLIVGAWACARLLSRASAAARSAAWASGLILSAALPFAMLLAPSWSVNAPPLMSVGRTVGAGVSDLGIDGPAGRRGSAPSPSSSHSSVAAGVLPSFRVDGIAAGILLFAPGLWLLGTFVALARLGAGVVANLRIRRAAEPLDDPSWIKVVAQGCAQVGLMQPPMISVSRMIAVPAVSGVLKPMLLLPLDAREWSESCRTVVVLHELAHLKRRDCLVQLLSDVARAFYWFHPLMHAAAARLRDEREHACDDVVIAAGTSPTVYADHLLDLVRAGMKLPPAPAVAFGAPSRLHSRIGAILDARRCRTAHHGRIVAVAVSASTVLLALLGGVRVNAQPVMAGHQVDYGGGVITRVITADTRQRAADALAAALYDGSDDVRNVGSSALAAIQAVGNGPVRVEEACGGNCVNFDQVLEPLQRAIMRLADEASIRRLASDDLEARRAAVGRVWARTERGAVALTKALLDDDRVVRNGAAIRLDSVNAPIALPNWIILLGDTDPMLRERAAISLGVIGDAHAIDPLADALRDPEAAVRLQAARALAVIALGQTTVREMVAGRGLQVRKVYRQEDGVTLPEVTREVRPRYTPEAMHARIQGRVLLRTIVEADGLVKDVEVVESLDTEHGLDDQATSALKQYEFTPGLWMGQPVPVLITVEMRFTLK
jgi:TonB family protein